MVRSRDLPSRDPLQALGGLVGPERYWRPVLPVGQRVDPLANNVIGGPVTHWVAHRILIFSLTILSHIGLPIPFLHKELDHEGWRASAGVPGTPDDGSLSDCWSYHAIRPYLWDTIATI